MGLRLSCLPLLHGQYSAAPVLRTLFDVRPCCPWVLSTNSKPCVSDQTLGLADAAQLDATETEAEAADGPASGATAAGRREQAKQARRWEQDGNVRSERSAHALHTSIAHAHARQ